MAETTHSINTAQGEFDVIRYSNGQEHIYSVDGGRKAHVSHQSVIEKHISPEDIQRQAEEKAGELGEAALGGAKSNSEDSNKQELRLGEAVWHSRKAGKAGEHNLKVTVLGPSSKYPPDGINPRNSKLYVELMTEAGTHEPNVRADRLEYSEKPEESSAKAAKGLDEGAAAAEKRLDKIIPPTRREKESKKEKTIDEQFEELFKKLDSKYEKRVRRIEEKLGIHDGKTKETPGTGKKEDLQEAKTEVKSPKPAESNPNEGGRELGNMLGDPNKVEIRGQSPKGEPFIYRRKEDGSWEVSRNGDLAKSWFEATTEDIARDLGLGEVSAAKAESKPESDKEKEEKLAQIRAAIAESDAKLTDLIKQLYENSDPKRRDELFAELKAEQAKREELAEKLAGEKAKPKEEASDTAATEVITDEEARKNSEQRRKNIFRRAWDRMMAPLYGNHSRIVTGPASEGSSSGGSSIAIVDETGAPVAAERTKVVERDRRRRNGLVAGALLVGTAVAAYFLGKSTGNAHIIHEFCHGHGSGIGPDHIPNHNAHTDFFNAAEGHRRTGVHFPQGIKIGHDAQGHDIIINSHNGETLVSHAELPHGIADHQNKLSQAARHWFESHGYKVTQEGIEQPDGKYSYMTSVS